MPSAPSLIPLFARDNTSDTISGVSYSNSFHYFTRTRVTGTGKVYGNVRARSVTVEGYLNGTIAAVDVILASTAVFTGEIVAERIRIDFGANVEGLLKATAKDTA